MKTTLILIAGATAVLASKPHTAHKHLHSHKRDLLGFSLDLNIEIGNVLRGLGHGKKGFKTTFFDGFDGESGTFPSSDNWMIDEGTEYPGGAPYWGNNEYEIYIKDTNNIRLTGDSTFEIIPTKVSSGNFSQGAWRSGRMESQRTDFMADEGGQLYVESRIKLGGAPAEQQQGIWKAFWALGEAFRGVYVNWPYPSEWDVLEQINGQSKIFTTLHCGSAPGGPCNEYNGIGTEAGTPISDAGGWHKYGFLVDRSMCGPHTNASYLDESINWYIDDVLVFNITGARVGVEDVWAQVAHQGHFLLYNVAVGGFWPGFPNNMTAEGPDVGMEVDYVGVWNLYPEHHY